MARRARPHCPATRTPARARRGRLELAAPHRASAITRVPNHLLRQDGPARAPPAPTCPRAGPCLARSHRRGGWQPTHAPTVAGWTSPRHIARSRSPACPITCAGTMGQPAHHPPLLALVPGHGWHGPTDVRATSTPATRARARRGRLDLAAPHRASAINLLPNHLLRARWASPRTTRPYLPSCRAMVGTVPPTRGQLTCQQPARAPTLAGWTAPRHSAPNHFSWHHGPARAPPALTYSRAGPWLSRPPTQGQETYQPPARAPQVRLAAPHGHRNLHLAQPLVAHTIGRRATRLLSRVVKLRAYPPISRARLPKQAAPRPPQNNDVRPSRAHTKPSPRGGAHPPNGAH